MNNDSDSDSDKALFEAAMKGVKPLRKSQKITPEHKVREAPRKKTVSHLKTVVKQTEIALSNPFDATDISAEEILSFGKARIQNKQFKALKTGQIRIEAKLDLHGLYIDDARDALMQFIDDAHTNHLRSVLVIHGKGGRFHGPPILKAHVNHWLKQLPQVLAFHSAMQKDGGSGAVYILISKGLTPS